MAIITISRGSLTGGRRLAECIGRELGYSVISREDLVEHASTWYGVAEENLTRGLERGPALLERFRIDRQIYFVVARATLCRLVREDDVVYHGHAGHLLLHGVPHVLRLRIIAPFGSRVRKAMEEHGLSEGEAEAFIRRQDEERRSWTKFLYGVDWGDPVLYDLTANLEKLTVEAICNLAAVLVARPELETTPEGRRRLDDVYLAAHVQARLYLNPKIAAAAGKIQVTASSGTVRLSGILPGEGLLREVLDTCESLPEVQRVESDWLAGSIQPT